MVAIVAMETAMVYLVIIATLLVDIPVKQMIPFSKTTTAKVGWLKR